MRKAPNNKNQITNKFQTPTLKFRTFENWSFDFEAYLGFEV
jgi:hypothetical protein